MHHREPKYVLALLLSAATLTGGGCAQAPRIDPAQRSPDGRVRSILTSEDPVLPLASGDTVHFGAEVDAFYAARDYRAAWTSEDGFLPRGQALVGALQGADAEGLSLASYHRDGIQQLVERARSDISNGLPVGDLLGNLDLVLTEAFLRYTTDIRRGTIDPEAAGLDWRVPQGDATDAAFLNALVESEDFEGTLETLRPEVPFYGYLRNALARYRAAREAGGWPEVEPGSTLHEGDRSPRVTQLRRRLLAEGDPVEAPLAEGASDPAVFDARLARAISHFQDRMGMAEDGAVGEETITAMNVPVEARLRSLRINLDRWRWLPEDLGDHYVLVNVAGFELVVMREGQPDLTMNVVVGKRGHETPIFQDTLEYVVVNPYWNVPESIAENEIWPAVDRDPTYLARHDYEVVGEGGSRRVRQRPGPGNALGEVKFLFPNDHNVYLHDTPADHLFGRQSRAFSHGCIRVEHPRELAYYLFENAAGRSRADYDRMRGTDEKWVKLDEKLPVYVLYFTAWAEEDGSVHFYRDIYDRDAKVERVAGTRLDEGLPEPEPADGHALAQAPPRRTTAR